MSAYLSVDIDRCIRLDHRMKTAWSDKTPMKVSLICVTCTDAHPGKTAYAAYGDDTKSFGQWRTKKRFKAAESDVEAVEEAVE